MCPPDFPTGVADRLREAVGRSVAAARRATGGHARNERWIVRFTDGGSVFVKIGPTAALARDLRVEHRVYSELAAAFQPRLVAWDDAPERPMLVLEDLSSARWPPPWSDRDVARVLATLDDVSASRVPPWVPPLEEMRAQLSGWRRVADDPQAFLALGLCSRAWLETWIASLAAAEAAADLSGDSLLHVDVRSDNICFRDDRALLVDWNRVHRGNRNFDVARWLVSLHAEGGPLPESVYRAPGSLLALVSGYWASVAGLAPPQSGSTIRPVQRRNLRAAMAWAARTLELPPPDGPGAGR
jgi:hypothetical protein